MASDGMSDTITSQQEALRVWPDEGVPLLRQWRGQYACVIGYRIVIARVWERLLDRGDLTLHESSDPNAIPYKMLYLSPQGRERARAARGVTE